MAKGKSPQSRKTLLLGISGAAVAVAAILIWVSTRGAAPVQPGIAKSDSELGAVRNVMGAATAKTTVVEYGDFQ